MTRTFPSNQIFLLIIFPFIVAFLWTCSSAYDYKNPEINLKKVRIIGIDQTAITLEGTLEISNPNDRNSRFSGYRYQLDVEGQRLMTGESNRPFEIPGRETVSITIPAVIQFQDLLMLNQKELFNRDLSYLLSGTVFLDSWMGKLSLPFSYENTINLPDLLREKTRQFLQGL